MVDKVNISEETSRNRSGPAKKIKGKIPQRILKSQREKMKRENLNELFFSLANALDQQTNGKASILCEATRLLKDLLHQTESLKKENSFLLSESFYVDMDKNELKEENSSLETQIQKLRGQIEARRAIQSEPDLNAPPVLEFQQQTVEPSSEQGPAVLAVPFRPHFQADIAGLASKSTFIVSKPHPRYPTPADNWPLQLLGQKPTSS